MDKQIYWVIEWTTN